MSSTCSSRFATHEQRAARNQSGVGVAGVFLMASAQVAILAFASIPATYFVARAWYRYLLAEFGSLTAIDTMLIPLLWQSSSSRPTLGRIFARGARTEDLKARRRELKRAGGLAIGITLTSLAIAVVAAAFTVGPDVLGVLQVAWFAAW